MNYEQKSNALLELLSQLADDTEYSKKIGAEKFKYYPGYIQRDLDIVMQRFLPKFKQF